MHGRRRLAVAVGIASMGAGVWMGRARVEHALLPRLPLHADCLDRIGGWADLARGDLPAADCPAAEPVYCEPALLLLDDAALALPARIVARAYAVDAGCPVDALPLDALTLAPTARRAAAAHDPWAAEPIAIHGLWADAVAARAVLGDPDALDLTADLIALDPLYRPAARAALGAGIAVDGTLPDGTEAGLARALQEAAGRPERGPNAPPPLAGLGDAEVLDALTGTGDATHALLAEAAAVRTWVGADAARLEVAVFHPLSAGSAPGDVHGAYQAGGGSPGATALAAELAWGPVTAAWSAAGVRVDAGASGWWMDGCAAPRRAGAGDTAAAAAPPLALALAERVGAALRAGDAEGARRADAALAGMLGGARPAWAPPALAALEAAAAREIEVASAPAASPETATSPAAPPLTLTPPWLPPPPPRRRGRRPPPPPPVAPPPPRDLADTLARTLSVDDLALAAWAAWRTHDDTLAALLLRDPPTAPWPRYAWRTVAAALGEPTTAPHRPEGCPPALWPGPG